MSAPEIHISPSCLRAQKISLHKKGAPIGAPQFPLAAAAATIVSGTTATTAVAEEQEQNDDPPPVVIQAAAQTVIIVTHKIYLQDFC